MGGDRGSRDGTRGHGFLGRGQSLGRSPKELSWARHGVLGLRIAIRLDKSHLGWAVELRRDPGLVVRTLVARAWPQPQRGDPCSSAWLCDNTENHNGHRYHLLSDF